MPEDLRYKTLLAANYADIMWEWKTDDGEFEEAHGQEDAREVTTGRDAEI